MKNIKILFMSLLFVFIAVSCENDGGDSVLNLTEGALPNILKDKATDQKLNVEALLTSGQDLNIGLDVNVATGDVASMNIVGYWVTKTKVTKGIIKTDVTPFPAKVIIKKADLLKAIPSITAFGNFDKLIISADLTLKNGTVIHTFTDAGLPNYGPDIANSTIWIVSQTYTPICPPLKDASVFNGDYKVALDQWGDYEVGVIVPVVYNAADGTKTFKIKSSSNVWINNASTAYLIVTFDPATNKVTLVSSEDYDYVDDGGTSSVNGTGTVDVCTGDLNLVLNFPGFATGSGRKLNLTKVQ